MFASAWQLFTAIFFFSALTKLVYKLIKEDRTTTTRRIVVLRTQQHHQEPAHHEEPQQQQQQEPAQFEQSQQQQQVLGANRTDEPVAAGLGVDSSVGSGVRYHQRQSLPLVSSSEPSLVRHSVAFVRQDHRRQEEEEAARQQQTLEEEQLDEDDEFEDTLSWAFQSQSERAELEEQRRTRWLTRQQFRRQLNRLNVAPVGVTDELETSEEDEVEGAEEEDEFGLDLASLGLASSYNQQQQQSPTSSGEYFDANEFSLSVSGQNAAYQHQQQQQVVQGDPQQHQQASFVSFYRSGQHQQQNSNNANKVNNENATDKLEHSELQHRLGQQQFGSVDQLNWIETGTGKERFNRNHTRDNDSSFSPASASERASNLTKLIGEAFLIEPLKLTCAILGQTFRTFCAFLDFIEGIETAQTSQETLVGGSGTRLGLGAEKAESLPSKGQRAAQRNYNQQQQTSHRWTSPIARIRIQQQQQAANSSSNRSEKRRSNYFHRRYLSRRSLSAALLNDSDRDEPDNELTNS